MNNKELPSWLKLIVICNGFVGMIMICLSLMLIYNTTFKNIINQIGSINDFTPSNSLEKGIVVDVYESDIDGFFTFEFASSDINSHDKWTSFSKLKKYKIGEVIEIETDIDDKNKKRIRTLEASLPSTGFIFPNFFLFVGLGIAGYHFWKGYKTYNCVVNGGYVKGKIVSLEETPITINDRRLYKVNYEYIHPEFGYCEMSIKTTKVKNLVKNEVCDLFYNPNNFDKGVLLKDLPYFVKKHLKKNSK